MLARLLRLKVEISEQEEVREGSAEVSAINVGLQAGAGKVYVLALGAEDLDGAVTGNVGLTNREAWLAIAEDAGASAEVMGAKFFEHGLHAARAEDVALVDEAVEHLGGRLHHLVLLFGENLLIRRLHVEDLVEGVIIVGHLL